MGIDQSGRLTLREKFLAMLIGEFALLAHWWLLRRFPDDQQAQYGRARARHFAHWSRGDMWRNKEYDPPKFAIFAGEEGQFIALGWNLEFHYEGDDVDEVEWDGYYIEEDEDVE